MGLGNLVYGMSTETWLASAIAPFALAVFLRIVLGNCRTTRILFSLGTAWFAINVLMAPYCFSVRQDLRNLGSLLR
jgi:hypothetical protein